MRPTRGLALALLPGLLLAAAPASAGLGSLQGDQVQWVAAQVKDVDVTIVDCFDLCRLTWESFGPSRLTLRCLDGTNETVTVVFPEPPRLGHPCVLESTLEVHEATESVVLWRATTCDHPGCEG